VPLRATLAGFSVGFLLACGASSSMTGPTSTESDETRAAIRWHGARVTGHRAAELLALLDRAAPAIAARWPGWRPVGWTIEGWAGRVPCATAVNGRPGGCRGTTETRARRIRISWVNGAADVVSIARWEVCNAARWDQARELRDVGCAP
jgi:hypothetical protein